MAVDCESCSLVQFLIFLYGLVGLVQVSFSVFIDGGSRGLN
jgi:hypothetical protein